MNTLNSLMENCEIVWSKYEVFRTLDRNVEGIFDIAISCDNSLPHLLNNRDLQKSMTRIFNKLKPGGLFLLIKSQANWVTHSYKTQYRALQRADFEEFLKASGFTLFEWLMPDVSNYYQPLVRAVRPEREVSHEK